MKVLYYDCFSGISGDMNIGALLDLGVPFEHLTAELKKLGLSDKYKLHVSKKIKMGIEGTKFDVELLEEHGDHDHDHGHGHGHDHKHDHSHEHKNDHNHKHEHDHSHDHGHDDHKHDHEHDHEHGHDHEHKHEHGHDHDHGTKRTVPSVSASGHSHVHRGFSDIKAIIEASSLNMPVKNRAIEIFYHLAVAEAKVHGTTVDEVHFHEVGAIDAIVDIVGAAICLDYLQVDQVYSLPPEVGSGFVKCAHGIMPVPAPATAGLLTGISFTQRIRGEATTPTGAAILKTTVHSFTRPENLIIEKIGYGLGTKDFEQPNVVRVYLGKVTAQSDDLQQATQYLLETNIDDMNPEFYGNLEKKLFAAGALDIFRTQITMKKGRMGIKLSILYSREDEGALLEVLFSETTTIGLRRTTVDKLMLSRKLASVDTPFGPLTVKQAFYKGKCVNAKPEADELIQMAEANNLSVKQLQRKVFPYLEEEHE